MKTLARVADADETRRRLGQLRADTPRRWGRMSAHQAVCHLGDAFRMALGTRPIADVRSPLPRALIKWTALYSPLPWPPGITTTPDLDQECSGTRPAAFAEDMRELERLIELFLERRGVADWPAHPIFGRMSDRDWMRWAYLHTDHHLRQFGV